MPPAAATATAATALVVAAHALPALGRPLARHGAARALAGTGRPGGVALTFDDGPDPAGTPAVLAALAALGWHATFFMLGSQVDARPDLARQVHQAGHEIGVHGFEHRNQLTLTPRACRRDLERACESLTRAVPGVALRWFRPPYGVLAAGSLLAARHQGLRPVLWSAWGRDWVPTDGETVARTVLAGVRDRGTVLLHDSDCTSSRGSWRSTVRAVPLLARGLAGRGLVVRTLGQHLGAGPGRC